MRNTVKMQIIDDKEAIDIAFFGVTSANDAQKALMQALINDKPFTFVTGPSGCGKTLMAQAVGLEQVIEDRRYRRMIYTRMQIQVGENLGALPGDINEKTYPFVARFMDNLEVMSDESRSEERRVGKECRFRRSREY